MSQYGTIYRLSWLTAQEDVTVTVNIFDTLHLIPDGDEPTVVPLIPTGSPFHVKTINNGRNKFGVFSKQATIEFYSTDQVNAYTFVDSPDNRWLVEAKTDGGDMIFTGFVELADVSRPFLPNPSIVVLTASDMLGILSDQQITTDSGDKLLGKYRIIELIALCLKKTGLSLEIWVSNNIRIYDGGFAPDTEHLYDTVYLDSLLTVEDVQNSITCFEMLEMILDKDCFLVQYKGAWWIMRPDDFDDSDVYITVFDADGENPAVEAGTTYVKSVGIAEDVKWLDASSVAQYSRPLKYSKHTFPLNIPDIPYNRTLEFGDLINTISPTQKQFRLDGWVLQQNLSSPTAPACFMYIERMYDGNGYETARYLLLTAPISPTSNNFATCPPMYIHVVDKIRFSVDFAWGADASSGSTYTQRVATIRLVADDGTFWMLDSDGRWYQSNSSWSVNFKDIEYQFVPNDADQTEYVTVEVESRQLPRSGMVYIDLYALNQQPSGIDDVDIHFTNIRLEYLPYINGSYETYDKQYSKVERSDTGYASNLDEDVSISDSPKMLVTGGLLRVDSWGTLFSGSLNFANGNHFDISGFVPYLVYPGQLIRVTGTASNNFVTRVTSVSYSTLLSATSIFVEATTVAETVSALLEAANFALASQFFNAAPWANGDPPSTDYVMPFEKIRVFSTFNQGRRSIRFFDGKLYGLGTDWPDMIHKYLLTDADMDSDDRRFMLISLDQDWKSCQWTGSFAETFHTDGKIYTDSFTFKYLNNG